MRLELERRAERSATMAIASPLIAVALTLVSAAMLCGARSLAAISQWGRDYNHLAPQLGFGRQARDGTYRTPCTSELHTLLAALP